MARIISACIYLCPVVSKRERRSRFEVAIWSQKDYVPPKKANGAFGMWVASGRAYSLSVFIGRCAIKMFNYQVKLLP